MMIKKSYILGAGVAIALLLPLHVAKADTANTTSAESSAYDGNGPANGSGTMGLPTRTTPPGTSPKTLSNTQASKEHSIQGSTVTTTHKSTENNGSTSNSASTTPDTQNPDGSVIH